MEQSLSFGYVPRPFNCLSLAFVTEKRFINLGTAIKKDRSRRDMKKISHGSNDTNYEPAELECVQSDAKTNSCEKQQAPLVENSPRFLCITKREDSPLGFSIAQFIFQCSASLLTSLENQLSLP